MTTVHNTQTITLAAAFEEYITYRRQFSPNTWAGERSGLFHFVGAMGPYRPVAELDGTTVDCWWANLPDLQKSTRKTRLSQLRSFLGFCVDKGWLAADPSAFIHVGKVTPRHRERLDAKELLQLLELAPNARDRILLALAMNLALRGSEICRLRIRDVDLDAATITATITKTGDITDVMPITVELDLELRRWLHIYRAATPGLTRDSYLVPSRHYQPSSGKETWRHDRELTEPYLPVKAALEAIGWEVTRYEGVHTIRRSMARIAYDLMLAENDPEALVTVMRLLHHTDPTTTLRYIGYDRQTEARDRFLKRQRFLTRGADTKTLRLVTGV